MKIGIVIPFFNRWDLTHKAMMQLYLYAPDFCEIYLVDDASTDPEIAGGVSWWQKQAGKHKIYYIKNEENRGFGYSMNKGCKAAIKQGVDAVVLLSNDVEVYNDFATPLAQLLEEKPKSFVGMEVFYNSTGWNNLPHFGTVPYANGWFLACTAEAWKDIGGFDMRYGKFDYEDIDISLSAQMKGYKLEVLQGARMRHIHGATIYALYPDRMEITKKNQQLFIEKWSQIPAEELKKAIYEQ